MNSEGSSEAGSAVRSGGDGGLPASGGRPPSSKAFLLLQWLIREDPSPEPFYANIRGQHWPGRFKREGDETVVDETTNVEHSSLMRWAIDLKSKADGRPCAGISIKPFIWYKNCSLKDYDAMYFGGVSTPQKSGSPPASRQRQRSAEEAQQARAAKEAKEAKEARREAESTQRRQQAASNRKKVPRTFDPVAQKLNADLDDYSRRRGRRGENVENYASCAWLMDCSAGLPASA
eukprot:28072-Rhodomonas_salina.1